MITPRNYPNVFLNRTIAVRLRILPAALQPQGQLLARGFGRRP
ncbi:hypothetical protein HNP98_004329 [Hymenobacter sp. 9A]|uniref:Uncharacterized protein n=1 Tax=Hymenobacter caeli TaxID=2735894 RepID=A0ABX2FYK1_9BACT|nr:hypothetical protein [Hymenobacter caeli]